jgi:hypothetical protein
MVRWRRAKVEGMKEMGGDEDDHPSARIGKFSPAFPEEIRPLSNSGPHIHPLPSRSSPPAHRSIVDLGASI